MSLYKKNGLTVAVGSVVVITTLLTFLSLSYEKTQIDHFAFGTVIFAEMVTLLGFLLFNKATNKSKIMLSAGAYTSLLVYVFVSIALAILFVLYFRSAVRTYISIQMGLFVFLITALSILYVSCTEISANNKQTLEQVTAFMTIESNVERMDHNPMNSKYHPQIHAIHENLASCDHSAYIQTDELIRARVYDLNSLLQSKNDQEDKIFELSHAILQLIRQRNLEVNQLKMGGI